MAVLRFFTHVLLPAGLGIAAGCFLISGTSELAGQSAPEPSPTEAEQALKPLPEDDETLVRLVVASGRTGEARKALDEALAEGADNHELVKWLGPLLSHDPGWLSVFLKKVPEDRRNELVVFVLGRVDTEVGWEVLGRCPEAQECLRISGAGKGGKPFPLRSTESPACEAFLFGVESGFSDKDLAALCRNGMPARRLLEEWTRGRWRGVEIKPGGMSFLENAWKDLRRSDPAALEALAGDPEGETAEMFVKFEKELQQEELLTRLSSYEKGRLPEVTAADLKQLDFDEAGELLADRSRSGLMLPLEVLREMPEEQVVFIADYVLETRNASDRKAVEDFVAGLDGAFPDSEVRSYLLGTAADWLYNRSGDFEVALSWSGRIPLEQEKARVEESLWQKYIAASPAAAESLLMRKMADGPLREELLRKVEDYKP